MYYSIYAYDKKDSLALRMDTRPTHVAHLQTANENFNVHVHHAGPLLCEKGGDPIGSLLVIEADDMAAAKKFADNDPYNKVGLFEKCDITPFKWIIGAPIS